MPKSLKIILVLIITGLICGWYLYTKPNSKLETARPAYSLNAGELFKAFEENENAANAKYNDKIVEVNGLVESVKQDTSGESILMLTAGQGMSGIICRMDKRVELKTVPVNGAKVHVKGICTGMLMDVVLVRCVIVE